MPEGLKASIKNTVDTSKIQKLARQAACLILVGFPSGRMHVPTIHKNEDGKYQGYNGEAVQDIEPIESAELAKMLSFGTASIPPRPFLDEGLESKKEELKKALEKEAEKAVNGGKANWNKVGTMAVGAIQEFVRSDYYKNSVPNSQRTIDYKGSDKPLIDGADLITSLSFVVKGTMDNEAYSKADFRSK